MGVLGTTGSTVGGLTMVTDYVVILGLVSVRCFLLDANLRKLPMCTVEP